MSASAEVSGLPVEEIETRVALIRPLLCWPVNVLVPLRKMSQGWSHFL